MDRARKGAELGILVGGTNIVYTAAMPFKLIGHFAFLFEMAKL